jgi:hypothetical protein
MSIELGEKLDGGALPVYERGARAGATPRGHIVQTKAGAWLAIPSHYRNIPWTVHKLRRDAIGALVNG